MSGMNLGGKVIALSRWQLVAHAFFAAHMLWQRAAREKWIRWCGDNAATNNNNDTWSTHFNLHLDLDNLNYHMGKTWHFGWFMRKILPFLETLTYIRIGTVWNMSFFWWTWQRSSPPYCSLFEFGPSLLHVPVVTIHWHQKQQSIAKNARSAKEAG